LPCIDESNEFPKSKRVSVLKKDDTMNMNNTNGGGAGPMVRVDDSVNNSFDEYLCRDDDFEESQQEPMNNGNQQALQDKFSS